MRDMTTDHLAACEAARDNVKAVLRTAFRGQNVRDFTEIMSAIDALTVAEIAAREDEWRASLRRDREHELAVKAAKAEARANRKAAALLRGDPDARRCTTCGRAEGEVEFYERKKKSSQCKSCEAEKRREKVA